MSPIGERLEEAREKRGFGKKRILLMLRREGVRGASHPMYQRYLKGPDKPNLPFLEAFARVCEVRPAWLICGEGEPTADEEMRRVRSDESALVRRIAELENPLCQEFPGYAALWPPAQSVVRHLWQACFDRAAELHLPQDPDAPVDWEEEVEPLREEVARAVGKALGDPLRALNVVLEEDPSPAVTHRYVAQMCFALMTLLPNR